MSLNMMKPLTPIAVYDPVIDYSENDQENNIAVVKGPSSLTVQQYRPSGGDNSDSEVNFNIFFPSRTSTCLSKCIVLSADMVVTIESSTNTNAQNLLSPNYGERIAPQSFPMSHGYSNISVDFDGNSWNLSLDQWYSQMKYLWFNEDDVKTWNTSTPTLLDNKPFYQNGTRDNVLASATEASYDSITPRGAFSIKSISNVLGTGTSPAKLTITYSIREPVPISPFLATQNKEALDVGFIGVSNLKLKLSFVSNLFNRCMKINTRADNSTFYTVDPVTGNFTAPSFAIKADGDVMRSASKKVSFTNIKATLQFYQLQLDQIPPPIVNYSWTNISYITQSINKINGVETVGTKGVPSETDVPTNSYQLASIPHKVFFAVVPDYAGTEKMPVNATADESMEPYEYGNIFLPITKVSILYGNVSGILNTADPNTLYQYSLRNGLSFIDYVRSGMGGAFENYGFTATGVKAGIPLGAPLILSFGTEITNNEPSLAPGCALNTNFQAQLTVTNYLPKDIKAKLITCFLYEGVLSLSQSGSSFIYSTLSRTDVVNSDENGALSINDLSSPLQYSGGSMWSSLKKFGKKTWKTLKSPQFRKTIGNVLNVGEHFGVPGAAMANDVLDAVSNLKGSSMVAGRLLNNKQIQGAAMVAGGAQLSAAQLRARLTK